jgi:hypothetical protein
LDVRHHNYEGQATIDAGKNISLGCSLHNGDGDATAIGYVYALTLLHLRHQPPHGLQALYLAVKFPLFDRSYILPTSRGPKPWREAMKEFANFG